MAVEVRLVGNWIVITGAESYQETICRVLSYTYKKFTVKFGSSGEIVSVRRKCYRIDETPDGRTAIIARRGFLRRITEILQKRQAEYTVIDTPWKDKPAFVFDEKVFAQLQPSLRPFQENCIRAIKESHSGLVKAATGLGKTYIIAALTALYPHATIDIVTRSVDVVRSIAKLCRNFDVNPGIVGGGSLDQRRVTVYSANSLHHSKFNADIVLADECHELVTPKVYPNLLRYKHSRMFGFSATVDTRADNAHFHLEELFGPVIFEVSYDDAVAAKVIVPIVVQWIPVRAVQGSTNIKDFVMRKRALIWRNSIRNAAIAQVAKKYFDAGKQVLILVETVEHLLRLRKLLPEFTVCAGSAVEISRQKLEDDEDRAIYDELHQSVKNRDIMRTQFRDRKIMGIIATGIWSTGVSFDDLEVLIRADGRVSKTVNVQAPGRVCRIPEATNKQAGIVIDFIDYFDPKMLRKSQSRFKVYQSLGWKQFNQSWILLRCL